MSCSRCFFYFLGCGFVFSGRRSANGRVKVVVFDVSCVCFAWGCFLPTLRFFVPYFLCSELFSVMRQYWRLCFSRGERYLSVASKLGTGQGTSDGCFPSLALMTTYLAAVFSALLT